MRQSTLLIVNTAATYGRMVLTVGVSLVVTRLLLGQLGAEEFGLFVLLGSTASLLAILSEALTQSAQRHLAYEIGREDHERCSAVFSSGFVVFGMMALLVLAIGCPLAYWIPQMVRIPDGRDFAAQIVFLFSVTKVASVIFATPFRAVLRARQAMVLGAGLDIVQVLLGLAAVLLMLALGGDDLIVYGGLHLCAEATALLITATVAWIKFPESRFQRKLVARSALWDLGTFASWSLLGQISWRLRMQGGMLLLNWFFGPAVNAAYGVAMQVVAYQRSLGYVITTASQPAIISLTAKGDKQSMRRLVLLSSKYPVLMMLFYVVPLEFEMRPVMTLWLGEVPEFAVSITRMVMVWVCLRVLSDGYQQAAYARGNIGRYTMLMTLPELAVLALAPLAIWLFDLPPWGLPATTIACMAGMSVMRVSYIGRRIGVPLSEWLRRAVWPVVAVGSIGGAAAWAVRNAVPELYWGPLPLRVVAVTIGYAAAALPALWWIGFEHDERDRFLRFGRDALSRLTRRRRRKARFESPSPAEAPR